MMHTNTNLRLKHSAVALALAGILLFFYGLVMSDPQFFVGGMKIRAAMLEPFVDDPSLLTQLHDAASADPTAAQGALFAAMLLMVVAAALDVWRRMFLLHHPEGFGIFDPMQDDGHDRIMDESHMW